MLSGIFSVSGTISVFSKEVLQLTVAHINTFYNPLPYYPCSDQSIKEWDDLLLEDWQKGNLEAANITKKHILESYLEYKKAQQDLKRAHKKKQKAVEELATVNRYLNAKHHQLKEILIEGRIDPILKKVIKQEDSWAHLHVPRHGSFEDELLSTPGICNAMQQTLAAFAIAAAKVVFPVTKSRYALEVREYKRHCISTLYQGDPTARLPEST
ncbi:hypothetical protein G6F22_009922 [Rhizopus arrhizus]|nr:hypothetical protein G6F22_009922 [Rhizopus arrhizus]